MDTPYGEVPDRFVKDMAPQEMHDYLRRRYGRRNVIKAGLGAGALAVAGPMLWKQSAAFAATTTGPQWISYGADPTTQMYVSWSAGSATAAPAPASAPTVRYGTSTSYGSTASATGRTVPIPAGYTQPSGDVDDTVYYYTELSGLAPGTTYHYAVSYDGVNYGPDTTFTTAKAGATNFRWVGTADEATSMVSTLPIAQLEASYQPAFTVVAGDLSYASGGVVLPSGGGTQPSYTPGDWDTYFSIIGPSIAQSVPWMVGVGNHEMEPLTDNGYAGFVTRFPQNYDTTSGSPVVQTFTYGNVAFIQLDGNDLSAEITPNNGYTQGAQTTWLSSKLAGYRAAGSGIDFIVVAFHNCMFCTNQTHGSDGGIRSVWEPIFDQYSVDLVLSGHVHAYERSYPLINGTPTTVVPSGGTVNAATQGTTYICAGGAGQSLYTTWYGVTGSGDAGTGSTSKINVWSGSETAKGGTGTSEDVTDPVVDFSAFRKAVYSFIVVDVTAPTTPGGQTTMHIQAIDPSQPAGTVSTVNPQVMDSVTLVRNAQPTAALPEAATPALLIGAGVLAAGGAAYVASSRRGSEAPAD
jgi:3',5'-cyclic AMP phosphodiesterase CpdA